MPPKKKTSSSEPATATSIRLPADLLRRADALVSSPHATKAFPSGRASGRIDRSHVLREAVRRGIEAFEARVRKEEEGRGRGED